MKTYTIAVQDQDRAGVVITALIEKKIPFALANRVSGREFTVAIEYRDRLKFIVHDADRHREKYKRFRQSKV